MSILQADAIESREAEVADWLHSVIDIPAAPPTPHEESTRGIHFRIPRTLSGSISKEDYYKYYEPRVVSIGPIHHGQPHVAPMEEFKRKALRELAERVNVSIDQVYISVEHDLLIARGCYSESNRSRFTHREWCLMMLLDGCFLMEFISKITSGSRSRWSNSMTKRDRNLVWRDLLLLENQLPFEVLYVLARAFRREKFIFELLTMRFLRMPLLPRYIFKLIRHEDIRQAPTHFLQYYRNLWMRVLFDYDIAEEEEEEEEEEVVVEEEEEDIFFVEEGHLLVCPPFSVTKLKKVNIRCSCARGPSIGIHFKSSMLSGKLFLPQLIIYERTMTLIYNLVAYEYSCSLQYRSSGISSYLSFMSMLINGEEDVKELRARGVIQVNFTIGDDQVVNFFKDITAHNEPNSQAFRRVKRQISTYLKSKHLPLKVACAEFKHKYFSGPWRFLVFLAVIFTVGVTVIQTLFTGIQTYK